MMSVEIIGAMNAPTPKGYYIDVDMTAIKTVAPKKNAKTARKILAIVKEAVEGIVFIAMFFTLIYGFSFLDLLTR